MKQTEIGLIPEDWNLVTVRDVATIYGRIGFRGYTIKDIVKEGYGAISLSPSNIKDGKINYNNCTYISWFKYEESPEIKVFNGDIILVKTGSTFGKSALVKNLKEKATLNPQVIVFKSMKMNNELFSYLVYASNFQNQIISAVVGGAIPTLSQEQVYNFKIPLPPVSEQIAISRVLSDCDVWIERLENVLSKKCLIKQGAIQELLNPKKDWEVKKLGEICDFGSGRDYKHLKKGSIPVYGTGGIMTYVDDYLFEGDSVGIGRKGTIDKPVFLSGKFWTVDTLFFTYSFKNLLPKYLYYQFLLIPWKEYNEASGVPSLNKNTLTQIEIKIPLLSEQIRLATILSDIDMEIEILSGKLNKAREIKQGMLQALLTGKIRLA